MDLGRQADMDHYYLSLGLGLPPYFRRLAENTRKRHFKSLLDREKLETSMQHDILGKLAEINFEFTEYEARSCVFAASSYFVSEGLFSLENVIGMIDHIVKIMETLKPSVPLLPSTSAALPKVPNESLLQHVDVDEPWSPPKSSAALPNKFASNDPVQHGGGSSQLKHPASTSTALRHLLGPPNPLNPANLAHILNP
ncbi:hypothetical protein EV361DRAFT_867046 [Lentinula raphanica]|uniref:Uncharacterized protein n=1 Tax=Lentinula raphanica TaxID=153919 RepID=A0AA38PIE6_9AGAR|nr:hypothetical protein F5880DRAFT_1173246 [Lentinula raphanica]KAJ3843533.1 hypothetical protein F5878DRAFT_270758 [Lentinula raphanica]KAJ3973256.1 hypothetical protein EV361DRAFT_867046 [Lentinula raphanica]